MPTAKDKQARSNRVVLYERVSSKDQEKEGYSIPAQQRLLRDYAGSGGSLFRALRRNLMGAAF
jgi:hypothetical protein